MACQSNQNDLVDDTDVIYVDDVDDYDDDEQQFRLSLSVGETFAGIYRVVF